MAGRPAMYRGDRRRKEDQRKAKQEAKKARKAERKESGTSGPEMAEAASPPDGTTIEYVWFSPSKARTVTTQIRLPAGGSRRRGLDTGERAAAQRVLTDRSEGPGAARSHPCPAKLRRR